MAFLFKVNMVFLFEMGMVISLVTHMVKILEIYKAPIADVVMSEECQSIPKTQPNRLKPKRITKPFKP